VSSNGNFRAEYFTKFFQRDVVNFSAGRKSIKRRKGVKRWVSLAHKQALFCYRHAFSSIHLGTFSSYC